MKRNFISIVLVLVLTTFYIVGCAHKTNSPESVSLQPKEESRIVETDARVEESSVAIKQENTDDGMKELEAIGNIEVDESIFDVEITVPADVLGETSQEELDAIVTEYGYQSATLNDDGSVTYVMTKKQHEDLLKEVAKGINESLSKMVGSEDYPNVTAITANEDFTKFILTTKNCEPDLTESFTVLTFYVYGGMYAIFSGSEVDNIHVDFINDASGEIISSADSNNMGE